MLTELPFNVDEIDTIIFDLDGTLYENQEQYGYYARRLATLVPVPARELFMNDLNAARDGHHALAYGWTYHLESRTLLTTDHMRPGPAVAGRTWSGETISDSQLRQHPMVLHDMKTYITASDPWWLPFICAVYHGVRIGETQRAYRDTRDMMLSTEFRYKAPRGIASCIHELSSRYHHVLATNSPEEDARRVFEALDISAGFDLHVYRAGKPGGLYSVMDMCRSRFLVGAPAILSIGDNPFNEVVPSLESGGRALLVDSARCYSHGFSLARRADTISDLLPALLKKKAFRAPFDGPPERRELAGF